MPAVRARIVAMLRNIDARLAKDVGADLGMEMPEPLPLAIKPRKPEIEVSRALSLFARPGDKSIRTRRIGILVADGVDTAAAMAVHAGLVSQGAIPRYIGPRLGPVTGEDEASIEVEVTLETMPSVLLDAIVVPGGEAFAKALGNIGQAAEFIVNAYRHCKPIFAIGAACTLVENAGVPRVLPSGEPDSGLLLVDDDAVESALPAFVQAIAKHRHNARETDPPPV